MKKWFIVFAALIAIIVIGQMLQEQKQKLTIESGNNKGMFVDKQSYELIHVDSMQIHQGQLLLINANYQLLNEGVEADIELMDEEQAALAGFALDNSDIMLSSEVLAALQKMIAAAKQDGLDNFLLTSGYRSLEHQALLYEQQGSDYALPAGYSEHNSGLAVDISSLTMKMETAPEGKWLQQHAADFGFILRYPPNKQHITGIQYEPWHFRYVGLPHSLMMREHDWVLEEYLDYLAANPHLTVSTSHGEFTIEFYEYKANLTIKLPSDASYLLSGNNDNGIIVTYWEEEEAL